MPLIVSEFQAAHLFTLKSYKDSRKVAVRKTLPEGILRINTTINEVSLDDLIDLVQHPDFGRDVESGSIAFIGNGKIVREVPMVPEKKKAEPKKGTKVQDPPEEYEAEEDKSPKMVLDVSAVREWPSKMEDIKSLLKFPPVPALYIVKNTIDLKYLKKWLELEQQQVDLKNRDSVVEALKKQIARIEAIDQSRKK